MEQFEVKDCGPKLKAALMEHFGSEEATVQGVRSWNNLVMLPSEFSSRYKTISDNADELIAVATASCSERGKTLLALVGEVLVERLTFKGDVPLIPYVLSMWVRRMAVFSSSL